MRRSCIPHLFVAIGLATFTYAAVQESPRKIRLAVLPFKNVATSIPAGEDVGRAVADMLITELFKLQRYEIVERNQLDKLMQERNLQQTDLAESSAREIAKVLKCDALVVGSISQYSETRQDRNFAFYRKEAATYTVGIEFRIIDVQTGATRLAESAVGVAEKEGRIGGLLFKGDDKKGNQHESPTQDVTGGYGEAARKAVDILVAKLRAAFPIEGHVADVDGDNITINLGRADNIRPGDRFKIVKVGKEIIDPVTKESLGAKTQEVGEMAIKEVIGERLSVGMALPGTGKVEVGNKVIAVYLQAAMTNESDKSDTKKKKKKHEDDDDD